MKHDLPICTVPRCHHYSRIQCEDCGKWVCEAHHARLADVRREHRKIDRTLCRDCADSYEQCRVCRFQIAPDDLVSTSEQDANGHEIYVCGDCFDEAETRRTARYDAAMDRAAEREGSWYDTTFAGAFPDDERRLQMETQSGWVLIGNRYLNLTHIAEAVVSCWDLTMRVDVVMANGSPTFSLTGDDAVALAESLHRRLYSDWTVWIIPRSAQVAFIRTWKDCGLAEVATLRNLACVATARQLSSNWIMLDRKAHYTWQEVKAAVSVACPAVQSSRVTAANVSMEPRGGKP